MFCCPAAHCARPLPCGLPPFFPVSADGFFVADIRSGNVPARYNGFPRRRGLSACFVASGGKVFPKKTCTLPQAGSVPAMQKKLPCRGGRICTVMRRKGAWRLLGQDVCRAHGKNVMYLTGEGAFRGARKAERAERAMKMQPAPKKPTRFCGSAFSRVPGALPECAQCVRYLPMSDMANWGRLLAWESMATADWVRIWLRTKRVISVATSTSEMRDSAACRFSA